MSPSLTRLFVLSPLSPLSAHSLSIPPPSFIHSFYLSSFRYRLPYFSLVFTPHPPTSFLSHSSSTHLILLPLLIRPPHSFPTPHSPTFHPSTHLPSTHLPPTLLLTTGPVLTDQLPGSPGQHVSSPQEHRLLRGSEAHLVNTFLPCSASLFFAVPSLSYCFVPNSSLLCLVALFAIPYSTSISTIPPPLPPFHLHFHLHFHHSTSTIPPPPSCSLFSLMLKKYKKLHERLTSNNNKQEAVALKLDVRLMLP